MSSKIMCVYKINNLVTGKFYIGSTNNKYRRWKAHRNALNHNRSHNPHFQNAWNKYGKNNFVFDIIEIVDDINNLLCSEQFWLDFFKSYDRKIGYNLSPTAGNTLGFKHSQESKNKLRNANFGKKYSKDVNKTKGRLGHKKSAMTRHKMSLAALGKNLGKVSYVKPVLQFDKDNNLVAKWKSVKEAAENNGIKLSGISQCCNGFVKTYKKYVWKFEFGDLKLKLTSDELRNR